MLKLFNPDILPNAQAETDSCFMHISSKRKEQTMKK
jgi:hypothetical protein